MISIILAWLAGWLPAATPSGNRVESFHSRLLGRDLLIALHIPEGAPQPGARLVLALPGAWDGPADFVKQGIFNALTLRERAGELPPALWVSVAHHRSWYADRKDGRFPFERFLVEELIPEIEARFPGYGGRPSSRSVTGLSMGGFGALNLAGRTQLFSRCAALSPALVLPPFKGAGWLVEMSLRRTFPTDLQGFAPWNPREHLAGTVELRVACGIQDHYGLAAACRDFQQTCEKKGRPMLLDLSEGDHDWAYWTPQFLRLAPWLNGR